MKDFMKMNPHMVSKKTHADADKQVKEIYQSQQSEHRKEMDSIIKRLERVEKSKGVKDA